KPLPLEDSATRMQFIRDLLGRQNAKGILDVAADYKFEELEPHDQIFVASARAARTALEQHAALEKQLQEKRAELAAQVQGKAVLLGWAALGATDIVPTAMH